MLEYVLSHIGKTIADCCKAVCEKAGLLREDIDFFYIYDPVPWMRDVAAKALASRLQKFIPASYYGSLGAILNIATLGELEKASLLHAESNVLSMGFGPMATATACPFKWSLWPARLSHAFK